MTITAIPDLPVLDPRKLTDQQLDHCRAIFEDFKDKPLLPANEAYHDETRKALATANCCSESPACCNSIRTWRKGG